MPYLRDTSGADSDVGLPESPGGSGLDEQVKVTASDTTKNYLDSKLSVGAGLSKSVTSPGGDEGLELSNTLTDAADITYTPTVVANWSGGSDPGNQDDANDQLASRVKSLENGEGSSSAVTGNVVQKINIEEAVTIPSGYEMVFVDSYTILPGGSITNNGELHVLDSTTYNNLQLIDYTPTTLSDWNSSTDPGTSKDAMDQVASRLKTVETNFGSLVQIETRWDPQAPPSSANAADDEFNDSSFDTGKWTAINQFEAPTEDAWGLRLRTGGDDFRTFYQSTPSSPFTAVMYCTMNGDDSVTGGADAWLGLGMLSGTATTAARVRGIMYKKNTSSVLYEDWSSHVAVSFSTSNGMGAYYSSDIWLRVRTNDGANFFFDWSSDGFGWITSGTISIASPFGLAILTSQNGTTSPQDVGRVKLFRVRSSFDDLYTPAYGRGVPVLA